MNRFPRVTHPCSPEGRSFNTDREVARFKKRQQLRENSVEIRELEANLRQAYINKELAIQRKEKELAEVQRRQEQELEAQLIEANRSQALKEEQESDRQEALDKIRFKQRLDGQVEEKQVELNQAYKDFLEEKQMIDDIIADFKKEEEDKMIEKLVKKQVEQESIQDFIRAQKDYHVKQQEKIVVENAKIQEFIAKKDAWREAQDKVTKERRLVKNEAVHRLGEKLERERVLAREKEALLYELNDGRQRDLYKILERQELEKSIRKRLNFKKSNEIALAYKQRLREQEQLEEERWKKFIMDESVKAAKLDQMSDQKRRMKRLELKREADRLFEEKKKLKELAKSEEEMFWQEQREAQRLRDLMIEDERRQILKEHADKLMGFLPMGILSEEDIEMLGKEDIRFLYKSRETNPSIDSLSVLERKFAPTSNI